MTCPSSKYTDGNDAILRPYFIDGDIACYPEDRMPKSICEECWEMNEEMYGVKPCDLGCPHLRVALGGSNCSEKAEENWVIRLVDGMPMRRKGCLLYEERSLSGE